MKEYSKDNLPEIGEVVEGFVNIDKKWYQGKLVSITIQSGGILFGIFIENLDGIISVNNCRPIPKYTPKFGDWVECMSGRVGFVTITNSERMNGAYLISFETDINIWAQPSELKPSTREAWEEQQKQKEDEK